MKVVILCGGIGYRLKEETEFKPKPMVLVGDKPILWHIMKIYAQHGYNEFIIALGYKGDYIKDYFLKQKFLLHDYTLHTKDGATVLHKNKQDEDDFIITFVDTGLESLPGERILRIKDYIPKDDKNFMVTYGDGLADINISKLVKFHENHSKIGTITAVHPTSRYGILTIGKKNIAYAFKEKPLLFDWINGGYMVFDKKFFKYLRNGEYEHPALKRLVNKRQLSVFPHKGFWYSMDTYADVENLNKLWRTDPKWKIWKK